jgi:hypothetical protein
MAYTIGSRTVHAQRAACHQIAAGLLADARGLGYLGYELPVAYQEPVRATWASPDGTRRTGMVSAAPGASAGST